MSDEWRPCVAAFNCGMSCSKCGADCSGLAWSVIDDSKPWKDEERMRSQPTKLLCGPCGEHWRNGEKARDQAMRWLRLRHCETLGRIRWWDIGSFWNVAWRHGRWFLRFAPCALCQPIERRTARALLHAAECYARGEM